MQKAGSEHKRVESGALVTVDCSQPGCQRAAYVIKDGAIRFKVRHDGAVHKVAISLELLRAVLMQNENGRE